MINLLPPQAKENIVFARRNAQLFRLSLILSWVIVGVVIIGASGIFYLKKTAESYEKQSAQSQSSLQIQNIDEVQKNIENFSNNLKLTTQVLSREVLFSKLIKQIGSVMPANTSLSDLKIIKTEGGIDLSAIASDYNTATQVQVNLADPANKIFDKVDIININCSTLGADPKYPCTINLRAQFGKNNSFLFINKGAKP